MFLIHTTNSPCLLLAINDILYRYYVRVYVNGNHTTTKNVTGETATTFDDLQPNDKLQFTVQAENIAGRSKITVRTEEKSVSAPSPPLKINYNIKERTIVPNLLTANVNWNQPQNDGNLKNDKYLIWYISWDPTEAETKCALNTTYVCGSVPKIFCTDADKGDKEVRCCFQPTPSRTQYLGKTEALQFVAEIHNVTATDHYFFSVKAENDVGTSSLAPIECEDEGLIFIEPKTPNAISVQLTKVNQHKGFLDTKDGKTCKEDKYGDPAADNKGVVVGTKSDARFDEKNRRVTVTVSWSGIEKGDTVTFYHVCHVVRNQNHNDTGATCYGNSSSSASQFIKNGAPSRVCNETKEHIRITKKNLKKKKYNVDGCVRVPNVLTVKFDVQCLAVKVGYVFYVIAENPAGFSFDNKETNYAVTVLDDADYIRVDPPLPARNVVGKRPKGPENVEVKFEATETLNDYGSLFGAKISILSTTYDIFCLQQPDLLAAATIADATTGEGTVLQLDNQSTYVQRMKQMKASENPCKNKNKLSRDFEVDPCCSKDGTLEPVDAILTMRYNLYGRGIPVFPIYFRVVARNRVAHAPASNISKMVVEGCAINEYFMNQHRENPDTWRCMACPTGARCESWIYTRPGVEASNTTRLTNTSTNISSAGEVATIAGNGSDGTSSNSIKKEEYGRGAGYGGTFSEIVAKKGYWLANVKWGESGTHPDLERRFVACVGDTACEGGTTLDYNAETSVGSVVHKCRIGFDEKSLMCSKCAQPHYSATSEACKECRTKNTETNASSACRIECPRGEEKYRGTVGGGCDLCAPQGQFANVLIMTSIILALIVAFMILTWTTINSKGKASSYFIILLKVLLNHQQLVALALGFKLNWPDDVKRMLESASLLGYWGSSFLKMDCVDFIILSDIESIPHRIATLYAAFPIILVGPIFLYWFFHGSISRCCKSCCNPAKRCCTSFFQKRCTRLAKLYENIQLEKMNRRNSRGRSEGNSRDSPSSDASFTAGASFASGISTTNSVASTGRYKVEGEENDANARKKAFGNANKLRLVDGTIKKGKLNQSAKRRKRKQEHALWKDHAILTTVILLWVLHPTLTRSAFTLFECETESTAAQFANATNANICKVNTTKAACVRKTPGSSSPSGLTHANVSWEGCCEVEGEKKQVLVGNHDVLCEMADNFWIYSIALGVPMSIIYAFGLPIALWIVLYKKRFTLSEAGQREKWGFMYSSFRISQPRKNRKTGKMQMEGQNMFFWEMVIMLRKVLLIMISVFAERAGIEVQTYLILMAVAIFFFVQVYFSPYLARGVNNLEAGSLATSLVTLMSGAYLNSAVVKESKGTLEGFTYFIVLVNFLYILYFLWIAAVMVLPVERLPVCHCGACCMRFKCCRRCEARHVRMQNRCKQRCWRTNSWCSRFFTVGSGCWESIRRRSTIGRSTIVGNSSFAGADFTINPIAPGHAARKAKTPKERSNAGRRALRKLAVTTEDELEELVKHAYIDREIPNELQYCVVCENER